MPSFSISGILGSKWSTLLDASLRQQGVSAFFQFGLFFTFRNRHPWAGESCHSNFVFTHHQQYRRGHPPLGMDFAWAIPSAAGEYGDNTRTPLMACGGSGTVLSDSLMETPYRCCVSVVHLVTCIGTICSAQFHAQAFAAHTLARELSQPSRPPPACRPLRALLPCRRPAAFRPGRGRVGPCP